MRYKHRYQWMVTIFFLTISGMVNANTMQVVTPAKASMHWFDAVNLPPGAKLAILSGNPKRHEFYVARLKLPANFTIPVHNHLTTEYNTVISGRYYLGLGSKSDRKSTVLLSPGDFIYFPPGVKHYGFTTEETILEVTGVGPWGTQPRQLRNPAG